MERKQDLLLIKNENEECSISQDDTLNFDGYASILINEIIGQTDI